MRYVCILFLSSRRAQRTLAYTRRLGNPHKYVVRASYFGRILFLLSSSGVY